MFIFFIFGITFKELSLKGARKIGFVGLPPIGCVPSQRTAAGGLSRECVPVRNEAASLFNSRISEEIDSLQMGMLINGTRIIFIDIYPLLLDIIQRPHVYGILFLSLPTNFFVSFN